MNTYLVRLFLQMVLNWRITFVVRVFHPVKQIYILPSALILLAKSLLLCITLIDIWKPCGFCHHLLLFDSKSALKTIQDLYSENPY